MADEGQELESKQAEDARKALRMRQIYGRPNVYTGIKPVNVPGREFAEQHPILQSIADMITGGATNPDFRPGVTDVLSSGIPFIPKLGKVFHGTQVPFEHFDPRMNKADDILGSYTHFAEDPAEADRWQQTYKFSPKRRENIIAAKLKGSNFLDLTDIDPEDAKEVAIHFEPHRKEEIMRAIEDGQKYPKYYPDQNKNYISMLVRFGLEKQPEALHRAGFDGLRYHDVSVKGYSWATGDPSKIETPWGVPMGKKPYESTLGRWYKSVTGKQ